MKITLKANNHFKVYSMSKTFTRPAYVWRTVVEQGTIKYRFERTIDGYRTRISAKEFTEAFNTLEIADIFPKQERGCEFVLFDFSTATLTPTIDEKLKALKKIRVYQRKGRLSPEKL